MEGEQQSDPSSSRKDVRDYVDNLEPGYRFCPTDSELIVHYLKKKIETGKHPQCRLYEINLYDHNPQELSERYRSHDNKWYFLTSRERKYPRGMRPSRITKNFGRWKTTQKYTTVYNDAREAVGSRRSLNYLDEKGNKTSWLMQEYTTNDPNLPIGSDGNKLSNWVLCKVYKKETMMIDNNNQSGQVRNARNQEQNQQGDEPPTRRRRVYTKNQPNEPKGIQNSTYVTPVRSMFTSYQQPVNNNIDGFGEPLLPQTHTRINPIYNRGLSSVVHEALVQVFAREQVGPYSNNYGGNVLGRVPNTLTSKDDPNPPVTWENLPPLTLTDRPHEDPTLVTLPNKIDEEQSPLTLIDGSLEDPCYSFDEEIQSLLNMF